MTIESQFDPVRLYTNLDPYNWQVDNRPLVDIDNNQSVLARFADAVSDSAKLSSMAAGFIARGFAQDDMFVGTLDFPGGLSLSIDHGFLVQSLQASPVPPIDLRKYPHLGLQQQPKLFVGGVDLQAPVTVGNRYLYTIQARKVAANSTLSHYDATNPHEAGVTVIGTVQFSLLVNELTSLDTEDIYPAPTSGWVSILHVKIEQGETTLSIANVESDRFLLDGGLKDTSQYDVYTVNKPDVTITDGVDTQITGIGVDVRDALVFLQGVYQNPADNYTIISDSEIVWNGIIPDGSKLDFVVIKSGVGLGGGGTGTYSYDIESFLASGTFSFTATGGTVKVEPFAHVGAVTGATIEVTSSTGVAIPPGTYTILATPTSTYIEFLAAVPDGSGTIDFYVTGYPVGQQLFGPTSVVDVSYSFVFVNGTYQPDSTFNAVAQTIYLPEPIPPGSIVDLAVTIGGISTGGIPGGGSPGQVLRTVNTGLEWSFPTRTLSVTSITSNTSVSTVLVCSADFDETTELYDGMLMRLSGFRDTGQFIGNRGTATVTIQVGATILDVRRPRGGFLLVDDLYDGAILSYNNTEAVLELVSPATTARVLCSSTGDITTDTVAVTPLQPIYNLFSGLQLTFPVPGLVPGDESVGTSVVLDLTTEGIGGPVVSKAITRNGGADLRPGDMVNGHTVTVQYDASLDLWVLMNPAVQSVANRFEFSGKRRQTVIKGPRWPVPGGRTQDYGNATASPGSGSYSSGGLLDYFKPALLQICNAAGVPHNTGTTDGYFCVNSAIPYDASTPSYIPPTIGPAYASFAAGYDDAGAVEYIEELPNSAAFDKVAITTAAFGGHSGRRNAEIQSMSRTSSSIVITFRNSDPAHAFSVGDWVDIRNSVNKWTNGTYQITSTSTYTITVAAPSAPGGSGTPWPSDSNNTSWTVSGVIFVYADRNPSTGAITYGYTKKRPVYISGAKAYLQSSSATTGLEQLMKKNGQHVFNIETMKMTVGNGSAYSDVQRVFLGEVSLGPTGFGMSHPQLITYLYNGEDELSLRTSALPPNGYVGRINVGMGTTLYSIDTSFAYGPTDYISPLDSIPEVQLQWQFTRADLPTTNAVGNGSINHGVTIIAKDAVDVRLSKWGNGTLNILDRDGEQQGVTLSSSGLQWVWKLKRDF